MISDHAILFLQNAWSPYYAGTIWPRESWIRALEKSRSGQRLRLFVDDFEICENTTPTVGKTASSKLPSDENHIRGILNRRDPQIVIACGSQAELALLKLWSGPILVLPHPAYRVLTDKLYQEAEQLLSSRYLARLALRQGRTGIIRQLL